MCASSQQSPAERRRMISWMEVRHDHHRSRSLHRQPRHPDDPLARHDPPRRLTASSIVIARDAPEPPFATSPGAAP